MGRRGPRISSVGYGGWEAGGEAWGTNPPDDQVIAALHASFEAGINWVDTAEIYGGGRSEELIGRAIDGHEDVVVFTKVAPAPRGTGIDPASITRAAKASLRRLRCEVIDVYQLHWPDSSIPVESSWEALAGLADAGVVKYIGLSNFPEDLIVRCERVRHVDSLQLHLSMLWRVNSGLLEFCKANGTGVIAYGCLAFGLLTGSITRETRFGPDDWRGGGHGLKAYGQLFAPGRIERNLNIIDRLRPVASGLDITLAQLALAWTNHQVGMTGAIAGSRSPQHVVENAAAANIELPEAVLSEIAAILEVDREEQS